MIFFDCVIIMLLLCNYYVIT